MRKDIQPIFKPHGGQAPLYGIQNEVAALANNVSKNGSVSLSAKEPLKEKVLNYKRELEEITLLVTRQTPFIADFHKIQDYLDRLLSILNSNQLLYLNRMSEEATELITHINNLGQNAQIL